ncbi:MAG: LolA-related protein [Steroidobacteraceae bacterium]
MSVPVGRAIGAEPDRALMQLMSDFSQRRHHHVRFTERQYIAILKRPVDSSGELFYEAPDRIEKRTLLPRPESMVLEGDTVTIRRGARTFTLALRDHPEIAPLIESIRATLVGDLAFLQSAYEVSFVSSAAEWTLKLVPRDARAAALIAQIRIAGSMDRIREMEFLRADGDRSVMTTVAEPAG